MATDLGYLSDDVKLIMKLLTANKYYALNGRTINLLMKGDIDMSATTSGKKRRDKRKWCYGYIFAWYWKRNWNIYSW